MKAGRLDRRITIQQRTEGSRTAAGEETFTWTDLVSMPAEFMPNRGQEIFSAQQKHAELDAMFRTRYYPGLKAEMRLIHEGVTYDIVATVPMRGRNTGLELYCKTGLTDG